MSLEDKFNAIAAGLPQVLANYAVNWTLDNFASQGWENGRQPWAKRKRETRKTRGRSLLIASGALRRSIQVIDVDSSLTGDRLIATFGSRGIAYARIHNEGGTITQAARSNNYTLGRYTRGKKKGAFKKGKLKPTGPGAGGRFSFKERNINIPRRQFIGASPILRQLLIQEGQQYIKRKIK